MWGSIDPALFTGRNTFLLDTPSTAAPPGPIAKQNASKPPSAPGTDFSSFLDFPSSPPQQPVQPVKPRSPPVNRVPSPTKEPTPPIKKATPPVKETTPPIKETALPVKHVGPRNPKESIFTPESSFYNGANGPSTVSQWPLDASSSPSRANTATDNTFGKAMANAKKSVPDMLASSFGQPAKPSSETTPAPIGKAQISAKTTSFGLFGQTSSNSNSSFASFGQLSNSKPSVGFSFGPSTTKVSSQPPAERVEETQRTQDGSVAPAVTRASTPQQTKQQPSQETAASYPVIDLADSDGEGQDADNTTEFDSSRPQSRENADPRLTLAKPSPPPLKRHRSEAETQPPRKAQRVASVNPFDLLADLAEESEAESLISQPHESSQAAHETFDTAPQVQQNHEHGHEHQHRRTSIELTAVDAQKYLQREASEDEEAPGFGEDMDALDAFNASHAARRDTSSASQSGFENDEEFDEEDGFDEDGSEAADLSYEMFKRYHPDQVEDDQDDEEELEPKQSKPVTYYQQFAQDAQRQAQLGLDDGLEYEDEDEDVEVDDGMDYSDEAGLVGPIGDEDGFENDGSLAEDDDESGDEEEDGGEDEDENETDSSRTSPPTKKRELITSRKHGNPSQQPSQLINGKGGTSAEDAIEL